MSKIEYSSIRITRALREAIRGTTELSGQNEENFIHQTLAFWVGNVIKKESEIISLKGESVEEDFELVKQWWTMQKEGKNVILAQGGNADQLQIMSEAMSKLYAEVIKEESKSGENNDSPDSPFKLLWKNIEHENEWIELKEQMSLKMMKGEITLDEYEEFVDKEGGKHRKERGYLQSEIPLQFVRRTQMGPMFPFDLLPDIFAITDNLPGMIEEVKKLGKIIDSGELSWEVVGKMLTFWILFKRACIKALGKKNAKKIVKEAKAWRNNKINEFLNKDKK